MLEHWNLIEADFQREYRLDLLAEFDTLSWRRFQALLNGLSPQSAFLNYMAHTRADNPDGGTRPTTAKKLLADPRAVARSIMNARSR